MQAKPATFRDLIDSMGGVSAFAAKTGIGDYAAKKMRDRNSIAVKHWPAVLKASDGLTTDDLLLMAVGAELEQGSAA